MAKTLSFLNSSGESVREPIMFKPLNITTATTTTVKSGAGVLHSIVVNSTAAGTIIIYNNTTATGTKLGTMKASIVEGTYLHDSHFDTGLTIVTGAASDITVNYL